MNADNILFRASSTGYLMVEPRSKSETISESTKTHLVDVFVSNKYGRNTDVFTKYTNKGLMVEEDSLTLYSLYKDKFYKKNVDRFSNEFICGTPDIILDDLLIDIKSSWDLYTFFRAQESNLNKKYYWQLQSYMALTGKEKAILAYCLIDTPDVLIQDEKRKLMWKMGATTDQDKDFEQACEEIDHNMIFSDIPLEEKVHEINIDRDEKAIQALYSKVELCREWMNKNLFKT